MKGKMAFPISVLVVLGFLFLGASSVAANPVPPLASGEIALAQGGSAGDSVPGEFIVKFKAGTRGSNVLGVANSLKAKTGSNVQIAKEMAMTGGTVKLLKLSESVNAKDTAAYLKTLPNVEFAEPNKVSRIPDVQTAQASSVPNTLPRAKAADGKLLTVETSNLKASASYPNDPQLWQNWGWQWVGADLVWTEPAVSPLVAVLDTGVDYTHPDLVGKVVLGYDWINGDANPMDDFGHGTHVAGIIAAKLNNGVGLAGVSNGQVLAIKVLSGQGSGTDFDVANGIYQAAYNPAVKVISMSLGGGGSQMEENAVHCAVAPTTQLSICPWQGGGIAGKGKLLVAAAGNSNTNSIVDSYPAAFSTYDYAGNLQSWGQDRVIAVAATTTPGNDWSPGVANSCRASFSNYGSWVNMTAPGKDIYSTTPWSTPFYMNHNYPYVPAKYAWMSGTSMATPFVAAGAARAWSVNPAAINTTIAAKLRSSGLPLTIDNSCWPASMNANAKELAVPLAMDRIGVDGYAHDAENDTGLAGGKVQAVLGAAIKDTSNIPAFPQDPSNTSSAWYELINVPFGASLKVNKVGYTVGFQTFRGPGLGAGELRPVDQVCNAPLAGSINANPPTYGPWSWWCYSGNVSVPPAPIVSVDPVTGAVTYNQDKVFVTDWWQSNFPELDQYLWLPVADNYIVGYLGETGTLVTFPWARWMDDGGSWSGNEPYESTRIRTCRAGTYRFMVTDNGSAAPEDFATIMANGWQDAVVRVFQGGVIKKQISLHGSSGAGSWWNVLDYNCVTNAISVNNVLGGDALMPYSGSSVFASAQRKGAKAGSAPTPTTQPKSGILVPTPTPTSTTQPKSGTPVPTPTPTLTTKSKGGSLTPSPAPKPGNGVSPQLPDTHPQK